LRQDRNDDVLAVITTIALVGGCALLINCPFSTEMAHHGV